MQINDDAILQFFARIAGWIVAGISTAFLGLSWYIWRGDRERIRILEDKVNRAITKPEVEQIVDKIKVDVHEQHNTIIVILDRRHDELREDLRDLRNLITGRWDGQNRRHQ